VSDCVCVCVIERERERNRAECQRSWFDEGWQTLTLDYIEMCPPYVSFHDFIRLPVLLMVYPLHIQARG
jgi:hypothetical protein